MATMCDELPRQVQSWISTSGLSSPLSIASVGETGISISSLSFRTSQSFRVINSRQCVYEALDADDQETLTNIRADGRVSLLFEVSTPTSQQVRVQGRGLVYERGSNAYNAIAPMASNWYPSALVSISVQRVWISNAGPLISPLSQQNANTTSSASATSSRNRSRRESSDGRATTTRRSSSNPHQIENWGWPAGGDSCCVT